MVNIYAYDKTVYINIPDGFDNDAICTVFNMMGKSNQREAGQRVKYAPGTF